MSYWSLLKFLVVQLNFIVFFSQQFLLESHKEINCPETNDVALGDMRQGQIYNISGLTNNWEYHCTSEGPEQQEMLR